MVVLVRLCTGTESQEVWKDETYDDEVIIGRTLVSTSNIDYMNIRIIIASGHT